MYVLVGQNNCQNQIGIKVKNELYSTLLSLQTPLQYKNNFRIEISIFTVYHHFDHFPVEILDSTYNK